MFTLHLRKGAGNVPTDVTVVAETLGPGTIVFAASRCSEGDVFNRKLGRRIAEGRLRKYMASDKSSLKPGIFVIESSDFSSESLHANARIIGANVANNRNFSGKVYRGKRK
jgi:hypothetical protein